MEIYTYGGDERLIHARRFLTEAEEVRKECCFSRLLLLPIPFSRDGHHINGTDLCTEVLKDEARPGTCLAGYQIPSSVREDFLAAGGVVCDIYKSEDFLVENARLTALGMLGILLTEWDRDLARLRVGIIGYGRIGTHLCRMLLTYGAEVTVFTTKSRTREGLGRCGVKSRSAEHIGPAELAGLDCLINTAPATLLTPEAGRVGLTVYELASGRNIPPEVPCTRLPSLPARMYPYSAGEAYGAAVLRMLFSQVNK